MARKPQPDVDEQLAALDALPGERAAKSRSAEARARERATIASPPKRRASPRTRCSTSCAGVAVRVRALPRQAAEAGPELLREEGDRARARRARLQRRRVLSRAALRYRQLEPVWGGTADTAVDVRASCAMGLVASGYSRALVELTALLNDTDAAARVGAVRAIACGNPREAELLLRSKALAGDAEPQVLGECFTGLLAVEPEESLGFVAATSRTPTTPCASSRRSRSASRGSTPRSRR